MRKHMAFIVRFAMRLRALRARVAFIGQRPRVRLIAHAVWQSALRALDHRGGHVPSTHVIEHVHRLVSASSARASFSRLR